jgi:hypothetical protein
MAYHRAMLRRFLTHGLASAAIFVGLAAACGGEAVVDAEGGAGHGGSTTTSTTTGTTTGTTSSTTTSTSTGTGTSTGTSTGTGTDNCLILEQELAAAISAAQSCEPTDPVVQCDGSAFVYDYCMCQLLANEHNLEAIDWAFDAFDAWVASGCGPWLCEWCPPLLPGFCAGSPGNGFCAVGEW